ncbi:MAG: Rieske (2Fe-2S) protein [Gammaproteobacteria bacterium]
MPLIKLCKISELTEVDSRGFVISEFSPERSIFIVRNYDVVVAYENTCPHNHGPLDWAPDVFLSDDKEFIQCASHGALFQIEDGECIYGPCSGQSLTTIEVQINDGVIYADL